MRIGILTIHSAHNYGAMLQAYAMRAYLLGQGHEASVIDYEPDFMNRPYKVLDITRITRSKRPKYSIPAFINEILLFRLRRLRRKPFMAFLHEYICPDSNGPLKEIPSGFDVYIIGSDQVWNTDITLGFEDPYFAIFPFAHESRKYIAYAASVGKESLTPKQQHEFKKRLDNFDDIFVREESARELLQPLTKRKIEVVLDPTLIASPVDVWEDMAKECPVKDKYVLVYQIFDHPDVLRIANDIARKLQARVIQLVAWPNRKLSDFENKQGPKEFVTLFKHAEYVVTTSFHGTAFSIIFNKNFNVVRLNNGRDGRAANLLKSVGLSDRIVGLADDVVPTEIDYSSPNKLLSDLRNKSETLLNRALYDKSKYNNTRL